MDVSPAYRNDAERRPEAEHRTAKVMFLCVEFMYGGLVGPYVVL